MEDVDETPYYSITDEEIEHIKHYFLMNRFFLSMFSNK